MYVTIFGISLGAWLLFEIWVFLRDRGKEGRGATPEGRRTFAVLAIAVALAMNLPGVAPRFDVRTNFAAYFAFGIALVWVGLLFRIWCIRTLGRFFSTQLVIQRDHDLITAGPYRSLRHPSYTGGLLTMIGLGISLGNGISLVVLLFTALIVYVRRIKAEENLLAAAFGDKYEAYRRRSWALIPFVW